MRGNSNKNNFVSWFLAVVCTTVLFISVPGAYGSENGRVARGMPQLHLEMECLNGGVGYDGQCLCPTHITGSRCENADECYQEVAHNYHLLNPFTNTEKNVSLNSCEITPALVCCWKERLAKYTTLNSDDMSVRIKNLLEYYGPWTANDRLMLDYFFGERGTEGKYATSAPTAAPEGPLEEHSLAFVIMVHLDFVERLPSLIESIYGKRHTYMIHADSSMSDYHWNWLNNFVNEHNERHQTKNIHLVQNRFHGGWGSISLVYLELASIIELLRVGDENGGSKWSHVINLSAFDYPIKPIGRIEKFLHQNQHSNFIEVLKPEYIRNQRRSQLHLSCGRNVLISNFTDNTVCTPGSENWMFKHKPGWEYGEGSQWHMLSREFMEYLVSSLDSIELLFSMKYTLIPDESFFQSAFLSSPFASTLVNYNYRYLPWADQLEVMPKHMTGLRETDALFVRKLIDPKMGSLIKRDVLAFHN